MAMLALDRGFTMTAPFLSASELDALRRACGELAAASNARSAGTRAALDAHPILRAAGESPVVRALIEPILGAEAFITRSILFDKNAQANWDVVWHQDTTIAVRERIDTPGFGPWSVKAGVAHVQPPATVLEGMLTVRLHIDDCDDHNGPLLVIPDSHTRGVLTAEAIDLTASSSPSIACTCPAGAALLMRPLLLHASRKAAAPTHRRVLHLEFAAEPLPGSLEWARL